MAEPIRDIRVIRGSHSFVRVHWCSSVVKPSVAAEPLWVIKENDYGLHGCHGWSGIAKSECRMPNILPTKYPATAGKLRKDAKSEKKIICFVRVVRVFRGHSPYEPSVISV
jgi:hypothetical protein